MKDACDRLPSPRQEGYERWLLDGRTQAPLALLQSSCDPVAAGPAEAARWSAGQAGRC